METKINSPLYFKKKIKRKTYFIIKFHFKKGVLMPLKMTNSLSKNNFVVLRVPTCIIHFTSKVSKQIAKSLRKKYF